MALWKNHGTPQALYVASRLTSRAVSVEFHNCNDFITRVARKLRVPTKHPRDILHSSPRGIILVKFIQIRWFSRRSGGGGLSGREVAQRRPRVSKLGLKGLPLQ
jgi:hypothetical protein